MQVIDRCSTLLAHAVRWLALLMVLITVLIVILRYAFNIGAIPLQEAVMYMHGCLFLLGIPYGVLKDTHVRVDMLYSRLSQPRKNLVDGIGHVIFLVPISVFIFVTSFPYVQASWRVLEGSSEVGGIPGIYLLKTLVPVTAALMFLQGLSELAKLIAQRQQRN